MVEPASLESQKVKELSDVSFQFKILDLIVHFAVHPFKALGLPCIQTVQTSGMQVLCVADLENQSREAIFLLYLKVRMVGKEGGWLVETESLITVNFRVQEVRRCVPNNTFP